MVGWGGGWMGVNGWFIDGWVGGWMHEWMMDT